MHLFSCSPFHRLLPSSGLSDPWDHLPAREHHGHHSHSEEQEPPLAHVLLYLQVSSSIAVNQDYISVRQFMLYLFIVLDYLWQVGVKDSRAIDLQKNKKFYHANNWGVAVHNRLCSAMWLLGGRDQSS